MYLIGQYSNFFYNWFDGSAPLPATGKWNNAETAHVFTASHDRAEMQTTMYEINVELKDNYTYINADGESLYILTGIMSA